MNFLKLLFTDPLKALGLESRTHGGADHGKLLTTIIIVWVMKFVEDHPNHFSVGLIALICAVAFGRAMYGRFLESRTLQTREMLERRDVTVEKDIKVKVDAPRDYTDGVQPWGGVEEYE